MGDYGQPGNRKTSHHLNNSWPAPHRITNLQVSADMVIVPGPFALTPGTRRSAEKPQQVNTFDTLISRQPCCDLRWPYNLTWHFKIANGGVPDSGTTLLSHPVTPQFDSAESSSSRPTSFREHLVVPAGQNCWQVGFS